MRKIYFLLLCFFTFGVLSAQEELTKEEQERREKNIQAGNPFAKFGYKAKVATLSKGKYLEVHDLDSIVTIGSIRFHVDKKEIVGNIVIDTTDMYARPIGDTPSRWLSPDPLSEEFSEWSPYTMSFDNPIRYVDPDGMAPTDIVILGKNNSSITVKTNLIDVKINAGAIVGDLGGNYSFSGNDFVITALDIVGVVDPTPASDLLSASLSAEGGDWWGVGASILGATLPYAGDLAKGPKIAKGLDKIFDAIDATKSSKKADFIVTPDGVAVPKSQSVMKKGFEDAGFPKKNATQTAENGSIYTVPTKNGKVDVRTMDGSAKHPKRAVITHPNTNNPKTPSGRATTNKKDNHIEQH